MFRFILRRWPVLLTTIVVMHGLDDFPDVLDFRGYDFNVGALPDRRLDHRSIYLLTRTLSRIHHLQLRRDFREIDSAVRG